jgi:hypothetical protein
MKPVPTHPVTQHARFMSAFCEDLLARDYHAPRAKAVCEISKQIHKEGRVLPNKRAATDS